MQMSIGCCTLQKINMLVSIGWWAFIVNANGGWTLEENKHVGGSQILGF